MRASGDSVHADNAIRSYIARVFSKDPTIIILVAIQEMSTNVVGHVIAEIVMDSGERIAVLHHGYAAYPGILDKMQRWADTWCRKNGIKRLRFEVPADRGYPTYNRLYARYGFRPLSQTMEKEIS